MGRLWIVNDEEDIETLSALLKLSTQDLHMARSIVIWIIYSSFGFRNSIHNVFRATNAIHAAHSTYRAGCQKYAMPSTFMHVSNTFQKLTVTFLPLSPYFPLLNPISSPAPSVVLALRFALCISRNCKHLSLPLRAARCARVAPCVLNGSGKRWKVFD